MTIDAAGIALIKEFEGLRLNAYRDTAGVWTIGYGSTRYADGRAVKPGDKLASEAEAIALMKETLAPYEATVRKNVKVPLSQGRYNSLVSFSYNEGAGALPASTLLKKLNAGDYAGAADQFLVWNKITDPHTGQKVVSPTLSARRAKERALFLKG